MTLSTKQRKRGYPQHTAEDIHNKDIYNDTLKKTKMQQKVYSERKS